MHLIDKVKINHSNFFTKIYVIFDKNFDRKIFSIIYYWYNVNLKKNRGQFGKILKSFKVSIS